MALQLAAALTNPGTMVYDDSTGNASYSCTVLASTPVSQVGQTSTSATDSGQGASQTDAPLADTGLPTSSSDSAISAASAGVTAAMALLSR